jgi:hypothetical protein
MSFGHVYRTGLSSPGVDVAEKVAMYCAMMCKIENSAYWIYFQVGHSSERNGPFKYLELAGSRSTNEIAQNSVRLAGGRMW